MMYRARDPYSRRVPKLWSETIGEHRLALRTAAIKAAAGLVTERGLRSLTMSEIAERAGIGRATLYKYFPDVEAILAAWHERQIAGHLSELHQARDESDDPARRLEGVLRAYALISRQSRRHRDGDLAALMHGSELVANAEREVLDLFAGVLAAAAGHGIVRKDVAPGELAAFCVHALSAAGDSTSAVAVERLLTMTLAGLRPESSMPDGKTAADGE